jgi:SAM-dependent methyltransferase
MLTNVQARILKTISPGAPTCCSGGAYAGKSKIAILLGAEFLNDIIGKVVIDFGCGEGTDAIEMVARGAKRVIGIDIREDVLEAARRNALSAGVQSLCSFTANAKDPADVIVSLDAFEHFADPADTLRIMASLLGDGGEVLVSFGPTWYHPLGGHLFSVFPWAHLLFSEKALIAWRSTFKTDGATRFEEVAGGLNKMTIGRFLRLVADSPFKVTGLKLVPIRKLRYFHNRLTREFTTAIVRCRLVKQRADELHLRSIRLRGANARDQLILRRNPGPSQSSKAGEYSTFLPVLACTEGRTLPSAGGFTSN